MVEGKDGDFGVDGLKLNVFLAVYSYHTTSVLYKSLGTLTHVLRQKMRNSFDGRKKKVPPAKGGGWFLRFAKYKCGPGALMGGGVHQLECCCSAWDLIHVLHPPSHWPLVCHHGPFVTMLGSFGMTLDT